MMPSQRNPTSHNLLPDISPAHQSADMYQRADDILLSDVDDHDGDDRRLDVIHDEIQEVPRPQTAVPAGIAVDERRYPARQRRPPDRYGLYLEH